MLKKIKNIDGWKWVYELVSLPGSEIKFPRFFYLVSYYYPNRFPELKLENENDVLDFIAWWEMCGQVNFPAVVWPEKIEDFPSILWDPDLSVEQDKILTLTKGLIATWRIHDWFHSCDMNVGEGRSRFFSWWLTHGQHDCRILKLSEKQHTFFHSAKETIEQDATFPISNGLYAYWNDDENLRTTFSLTTKESRQCFIDWWLANWKTHCPFLNPFFVKNKKIEPVTRIHPAEQSILGSFHENGMNIVGFAKGVMGIGEDTRMASLSSSKSSIPFSVYNIPIELTVKTDINEIDHHIQSEPVYETNLICLPVMDIFYVYLKMGDRIFKNRYNIGAWQWELPNWPEKFNPFFDTMNEIWAFSRYAEKTFLKSATIPVIYMPMAVEIPVLIKRDRKAFQLPENKFLFLVMFDANSWIKRKNPIAAIKAFKLAFQQDTEVNLIIKTMNVKENDPDWEAIKKITEGDTRIIIISETLGRNETISLIDCCDCYVSLHRAEGFGRIIAESMLLGKPVIVTNFSGNTDFTTPDTAFMVEGKMINLNPGDYCVWENQYWCDPDIDQAAAQMRLCFENKSLREKISVSGQEYMKKHHSAEVIGEKYKKRLREIGVI